MKFRDRCTNHSERIGWVNTMRKMSAHEVRDTIIDRMVNELYPVGTKLPTARELASELGVHRNTVSKAYSLLSDLGLVVSRQGRGTYAVSVPDQYLQPNLTQQFHDDLRGVITAARRLGMQEEDLRSRLDQVIADAYDQPTAIGVFVECNESDLRGGIVEIEETTHVRLDGMLLDEFRKDGKRISETYSAVFTNLIHIKEVSDHMAAVSADVRIIGIHTVPDEAALVQIAGIRPGSLVGIVVDSPEGAKRFSNQISACNSVELRVELSTNDDDLRAFASQVEVIVCNRSREAQLARLLLGVPLITLPFHISRQSALRVFDALHKPGRRSHPDSIVNTDLDAPRSRVTITG